MKNGDASFRLVETPKPYPRWLCLAVIPLVLISCQSNRFPVAVEEHNGLRATVASFAWLDRDIALISYQFEWTQPDPRWLINQNESVILKFWDANGQQLEPVEGQRAFFRPDRLFIDRSVNEGSAPLGVRIPPGTEKLSVAFGRSGLLTYVDGVSAGRP